MHSDPDDLALLAIGEHIGPAEAHVEQCPQCAGEFAELTRAAGLTRSAASDPQALVVPPPAVWERTVAELQLVSLRPGDAVADEAADRVRQTNVARPNLENDAPEHADRRTGRGEERHRGHHRRKTTGARTKWWPQIAVAAVLAAIVGFAGGLLLPRQLNSSKIISSAQLTALPSWKGSSGSAQIERSRDGSEYLHITIDVAKPFDGNREVWLATADLSHMRSLGYLNDRSGSYQVPAGLNLRNFTVVDVSAEPRPDPSPGHSDQSIVRGKLQQ
ncbi:hypothetical protein FOE78_05375 [Microlunatus elymi]|uniref:Anti-sigma-K factor rskA n=1 Tax=Microlunatus elymi TaxID=2596828 RepID=A0A516PW60_9ACTN|nr:anti-sigma factor [Microlunatus elymi]QDP95415.1 hypothetical protein FOE78_05375 [Microlunatus elymi]